MSTEICNYEGDDSMFKGIIAFLSFINAPFSIDASSSDGNTDPSNLINQDGMFSIWKSYEDDRNPFFQIDFQDMRVAVKSYSLCSGDNTMDDRDPATWILCGSDDQETWYNLDQQEDTRIISGPMQKSHIECENRESDDAFRYIRMQMVEPNHRGDWVFRLAQFEIFGEIHNIPSDD